MIIWNLLQLELARQWRQPRAWVTVVLFVLAAMLVLFFGFNRMRPETWAVMFWVILLFSGINSAVGEDAYKGQEERFLLVQWAGAVHAYAAKLLYNFLLILVLAFLQYGCMVLFFSAALPFIGKTLLLLTIGSLSLSVVFSFVSAIVSSAEKGSAMATLLAFPIIIPAMLLLIRMTYALMGLVEVEFFMQDVWSLLGLDALLLGVGLVLYPVIWKS